MTQEPRSQNVLRRATTTKLKDFDDQLWPIHVGIIVLACFVGGVVSSLSDFHDPRILYNGWVRLASVFLMASIASWAAVWLQEKVTTRRIQLCVIVSLLFHLLLALFLHDQYLTQVAKHEAELARQLAELPDPVTVPDYHWQQIEQPDATQPFEKLIETDAPEEPGLKPPMQDHPKDTPSVERFKPVDLEPPRKPKPEHVQLTRAELSAPRRAEIPTGEKISRQEWKHSLEPNEPIPSPKIREAGRRSPSELKPQVSIERKSTETPRHQRQTFDVLSGDLRSQKARHLNRRAPRESIPFDRPTTPTPTRQLFQVAEIPRTEAHAPEPTQAIHTPRSQLEARPQVTLRQEAASMTVHRANDPSPEFPRQVARAVAEQRHSDPQPELTRTPLPSPIRRNLQVATPSVSPIEPAPELAPSRSIPLQVSLDAANTPIPRQAAIRSLTESLKESVELAMVERSIKVARARPRLQRRESSPAPALSTRPATSTQKTRRAVPGQVRISTRVVAPSTAPSPSAEASGNRSLDARPMDAVRAPAALVPSAVGETSGNTPPAMSGLPGELARQLPVESAAAPGLTSVTPGLTVGPRRLPHDRNKGPTLAAVIGGTPSRKSIAPGLPRGLAEVDLPKASKKSTEPGDLDVVAGTRVGQPSRHEGGLPVLIAAVPGPGGLQSHASPLIGIADRRARPESDLVQPVSRRFILPKTSGTLALDGHIRETAVPFRQRDPSQRTRASLGLGGSEKTERAVELGLDFFARHQFPDGRWALDRVPDRSNLAYSGAGFGQMHSDTAGTGLSLLAFLGAGYTHLEDKHRETVRKGLDWLVANQQSDGALFNDRSDKTRFARSYAHGIAAIALCEAYGMTRDPALREPARKAVEYIASSQHPDLGGWRYSPKSSGAEWPRESDTSVSGWQLMALKSAQMAELEVPEEVLERVSSWLDRAQVDEGAQYVYNPFAPNTHAQRSGRLPNLAMTAEGLLMRMYLGRQRDDRAMIRGADHLKANLPRVGTVAESSRDVYFWYYATQVMFQMKGDYWTAWNDRLKPLLVSGQTQKGELAGSWAPFHPTPDRWANAGGRHYVTALNLLMLEVYYRHLPLFKVLDE